MEDGDEPGEWHTPDGSILDDSQLAFIHSRRRGYTPRPQQRPRGRVRSKGSSSVMLYDGLILLVLVLAAWRGAAKGLAWQVAWIGGIVLCFLFATPLSLFVTPHIKLDPPLNRWVAMLLIYVAFSFGCFAIARTLRGWLEEAKFQEFDKHLGAVLGLAKGVAIALVLTFFLLGLSETARGYILKTNSGHAAVAAFRYLHPIMPREIEHVLERYDRIWMPDSPNPPSEDDRRDFDNGPYYLDRRDPAWNPSPHPRPPFGRAGHRPESLPLSTGEPTDSDSTTSGAAEPPATGRDEVIASVVRVLSGDEDERSEMARDIRTGLVGVPDQVAAAALRDWLVDLTGEGTDPDQATDVTTSLDQRIVRQLERLGIPESRLNQALRERLRGVRQP